MAYTPKVEPASIREAKITALVDDSKQTEPFYEYQSRVYDLPIIHVPIDLPIYRMANFRTRTAQQTWARREGKPTDFFITGEENELAQKHQHEFLVKYAKEGREGSITPIIDVLKKDKQRQPILITRRGVVVNGNRRLAAMRALFDEEPTNYSEFNVIKCQVLPLTATAEEIIQVEVRLQMKQRTELDYDWINECIAIRELRDSGMGPKKLMDLMNKKKGEIEDANNALTEANLYLSDWLKRPGDYEAIEDAKQLFYDMGENISQKTGEAQEVSRRIAWLLADRRSALKRRVYDYKPMFGKKSDEVASKLAERFAVELDEGSPTAEDDDEEFAIDLGGEGGSTFRPLITLINDPAKRTEVTDQLIDVCKGILELESETKEGQMPLTQIQSANGKLAAVDMTRADKNSLAAIGKQLDAVEAHVTRLRSLLAKTQTSTDGKTN